MAVKNVKLTETDLNRIISESVRNIINEGNLMKNIGNALHGAYAGYRVAKNSSRDATYRDYNSEANANFYYHAQVIRQTISLLYSDVERLSNVFNEHEFGDLTDTINALKNVKYHLKVIEDNIMKSSSHQVKGLDNVSDFGKKDF